MKHTSFPYARWTKFLGLLIILIGIVSFCLQYSRKGLLDYNDLAIGLSWGLVLIYFSKEKEDDEMIHALKFKALARAIIVAFFITHLYNYLVLNWGYKKEHNLILSISAYQFLALTFIIATLNFHYSKHHSSLSNNK